MAQARSALSKLRGLGLLRRCYGHRVSAQPERAPSGDMAATGDPQMGDRRRVLRDALGWIVQTLHDAHELAAGEAALDSIAKMLDMPWPCWVPDISHPYYCRLSDEFSRSRGWPDELQQFWWSRHATVKMPFYIRCRFEHLPFVATLDRTSHHRRPERLSHDHTRITELMRRLGITTMLSVPLHLPKGQIATLTWAGSRDASELQSLLGTITGDLLAVGHNFMRIYNVQVGQPKATREERAQLTPRQRDCLRTLAQGYREAEVAEVTGITKSTVRYHLENVVQKLGCKNRTQALALAAQLGLLGPVGP
jgi:DNA-binding CsgD family transcriptional regulator